MSSKSDAYKRRQKNRLLRKYGDIFKLLLATLTSVMSGSFAWSRPGSKSLSCKQETSTSKKKQRYQLLGVLLPLFLTLSRPLQLHGFHASLFGQRHWRSSQKHMLFLLSKSSSITLLHDISQHRSRKSMSTFPFSSLPSGTPLFSINDEKDFHAASSNFEKALVDDINKTKENPIELLYSTHMLEDFWDELPDEKLYLLLDKLRILEKETSGIGSDVGQDATLKRFSDYCQNRQRHIDIQSILISPDPNGLFAQLRASWRNSESHGVENFQSIVTTRLNALQMPDLAQIVHKTLSSTSSLSRQHIPPSLTDLLLETITARVRANSSPSSPSLPGSTWVRLLQASSSLSPAVKARLAGQQFRQALVLDLPHRLSSLAPADLALAVQIWPRPPAHLDAFSRRLIQAILAQSIDSLHRFKPLELVQLLRGLRRPMTRDRRTTIEALDAARLETPDVNNRQRLIKAATKQLARRVEELGPDDLSAFMQMCVTDLTFEDWARDLGVAFPRAYTRAVFKHIPAMRPLQLLPVLSAFLFLHTVFHFSAGTDYYRRLENLVLASFEKNGRDVNHSDLVLFVHTFAMLAGPDHDPATVIAMLSSRTLQRVSHLQSGAFRRLMEALALPTHSYIPTNAQLAVILKHAVRHLLSASQDFSWIDRMSTLKFAGGLIEKRALWSLRFSKRAYQESEMPGGGGPFA